MPEFRILGICTGQIYICTLQTFSLFHNIYAAQHTKELMKNFHRTVFLLFSCKEPLISKVKFGLTWLLGFSNHTPARSQPELVVGNEVAVVLHRRTEFLNPSALDPAHLNSTTKSY